MKLVVVFLLLINAVYSFSQEKVNIKGVYEILNDKKSYELSKSDTIRFERMSLRDASSDKDGIKDVSRKHEYVDLGLTSGTLWATTNIGAVSPENYGSFFAWGETQIKNEIYGSYWSATVCNEAPEFVHYMLFYSKYVFDFIILYRYANTSGYK